MAPERPGAPPPWHWFSIYACSWSVSRPTFWWTSLMQKPRWRMPIVIHQPMLPA